MTSPARQIILGAENAWQVNLLLEMGEKGDVMLDVEVSQITSQQQNTDDRDCPALSGATLHLCPTISWYAMYASIYFGAGTVAIDSQLQ